MRKIYLTFMIMVLATAGVMAQAQVGIRAGLNVSTVGNDYEIAEEEPWRAGLNVGIATQFRAGEVFSFAPELMYTQRGFREEFDGGLTREARFDYLNVPLLFRLHFGDILKGYINLGPTVGYWLGGRQSADIIPDLEVSRAYDESITFEDLDEDWAYDASRLEIGGAVGGGLMLDTEGGSFLIDLRYTHGFTNIADFADTDSYKNRVVSVSLIYLVPSARPTTVTY